MENFLEFVTDICVKSNSHSLNSSLEKNVSESETDKFERIKMLEKVLKKMTLNQTNDENSNIVNDDCEVLRANISDLSKENERLKENEISLLSKIDELKQISVNNNIPIDFIELRLENAKTAKKLKMTQETLERLNEKFARNRKVLEENYKKTTEEIKVLDNFIAIIIEKLNNLPADLKNMVALKEIYAIINENETEL